MTTERKPAAKRTRKVCACCNDLLGSYSVCGQCHDDVVTEHETEAADRAYDTLLAELRSTYLPHYRAMTA